MTENEAREQIAEIWMAWTRRSHAEPAVDHLRFLEWLERHRPELLRLPCASKESWDRVRGWLIEMDEDLALHSPNSPPPFDRA